MQPDDRLDEEAAAWAVRTGDAGFAEWDEFTAWLEQSPSHAAAYDRVAAAVAEAAEGLPSSASAAANDDETQPTGISRRWFGGAIAASLAALVVFGVWRGDGMYVETTAPGETRMIALEDGSRIDLAGGSGRRQTFGHFGHGGGHAIVSRGVARRLLEPGGEFVPFREPGIPGAHGPGSGLFGKAVVRLHRAILLQTRRSRSAHPSSCRSFRSANAR